MRSRRAVRAGLTALVAVLAPWAAVEGTWAQEEAAVAPSVDGTAAVAYQHNPGHDGYSVDPEFTAPLDLAWSRKFEGPVGYPLIADGLVFAAVAKPGAAYVQAFSVATGEVRWGPVAVGGQDSGILSIAYDRGRVFAITFRGQLTALDAATGVIAWSEQLTGQYSFDAPPTAVNGTVYVPGAGTNNTLYAVDEDTGDIRWASWSLWSGTSQNAPAVDDTGIYVTGPCSETFGFDLEGTRVWNYSPRCSGGGGLTSVLHAGRLYVRDTIHQGYMSTILDAATGKEIGMFDSKVAPAIDPAGRMVTVWDGFLSVSDSVTGARIWRTGPSDYVTAPLIVNDYVVEGRHDGTVEMRDIDDGTLAWRGEVGTPIPPADSTLPLTGLAQGDGALVVPAGSTLSVFLPSPPRVTITDGPADGAVVGPAPSISFTSNVPDNFVCTLDGKTGGCTSPVALNGLSDGPHRFAVALERSEGTFASTTFVVDALAPAVSLEKLRPGPARSALVRARWKGADGRSGVSVYELRRRSARLGVRLADWTTMGTTTATSAQLNLRRGWRLCVSVRAQDAAGNWSDWSASQCARRPRTRK